MFPNRENKAVLHTIVRKAFNVHFGTVTERHQKAIERKFIALRKDQIILAQVAKRSISILNVT